MEHYEMAELLSRKANVSLEEARQVLTENDWDILDAMVVLERRGRSAVSAVSVQTDGAEHAAAEPRPVKSAPKREPIFTNGFAAIWHYIRRLCRLSVETNFAVIRKEKELLAMPVLVLVVLLISCFWVTLPLLVIGLFVGCSYRFEGKTGAEAANRAMEKLDDVVENIKEGLDSEN